MKKLSNVTITKEWFDEIKDKIEYDNPYVYTRDNTEYVEVDVDLCQFEKVSIDLGWKVPERGECYDNYNR